MGIFSIWHWAILITLGWILLSALGLRRNGTQTYVIKEWIASETPKQDGVYVHITGRKSGLISFLLATVGIDPTVSLIVDREFVRFKEGSWTGFKSCVTPIEKICSGHFGYSKPFWSTVFWVVIGFVLLVPTFGISLILILGAIFFYFLNKTTELGMTYIGGGNNGFAFKRSIIEGENIDEFAAEHIVSIIEMIMHGKDKPRAVNANAGARVSGGVDAGEQARQKMDAFKEQALRAGERAASKVATSLAAASENMARAAKAPESKCPSCGETTKSEDVFCGSCGHTLR